uniref:SSD domain-containing protein n=1 Tax=Schistocephalus solidus TaxID=70667 RepID=A0A0X3PKS2_SCHSO
MEINQMRYTLICLNLLWMCEFSHTNCVMYGICDDKKQLYCAASGSPRQNTEIDLQNVCGISGEMACCDSNQLKLLTRSLSQLAILAYHTANDPTCYERLVKILCDMTCSTTQANFITVNSIGANNAVKTIQYNIAMEHARETYDICERTTSVLLGKVISYICDESDCGMEKFFASFGKSIENGGKAPFQIDYNLIDSNVSSLHSSTAESSTIAITSEPATSPQSPVISWIREHVWWFSMIFVFLGLTQIFLLSLLVMWCRQRQDDENSSVYKTSPPISCYSKIGATIQYGVSWFFQRQGALVARFPILTLVAICIVLAVLFCGFTRFRVTTDPIELWSDPTSRARLEKDYFDSHFGPFHRIQQLILQPNSLKPYSKALGPVFHAAFLEEVLDLQKKVENITIYVSKLERYANLLEICYKPLDPDFSACAIFSPLEYFQSESSKLASPAYVDHITFCTKSFASDNGPLGSCRGRSGLPMFPNVVFGGFIADNHFGAEAVVITLMTRNFLDQNSDLAAITYVWESAFIELVHKWQLEHPNVTVSFKAERSVEDEIDRQSHSDISTVLISYVVMFVYVSVSLGNYHSWRSIMIDLKLSLSAGGVIIVLASIFASIGLWSYAGVPATLIIVEVIPFLVLAVGVDNIFIMVQDFSMHSDYTGNDAPEDSHSIDAGQGKDDHYQSVESATDAAYELDVEERISRMMGRIGPSILLSSLSEAVAFFCGAMTSMPAVRVFALYAGVAILINFFSSNLCVRGSDNVGC